jgi:hypothetical protein
LDCKINHHHSSDFNKPVETAQTTSKVRHISDTALCEYASQMMSSHLCGHLRTLYLHFTHLSIGWQTILPQMKNMPVLKRLILSIPSLSVADMELIHNNIQSIEDFELNIVAIQDSEMLPVIIPTTQLATMSFEIKFIYDLEIHMKWYRYMTQNYASVTEWDYDDLCLGLEKDEYFKYENGHLEFLALTASTQFAPSLDDLPDYINIFKMLDSRDCRLPYISLSNHHKQPAFGNLVYSKMAQYIKRLCISGIELYSYDNFEKFTPLSILELYNISHFNSDLLNLDDCLNSPPDTLTDLKVQIDYLEARPINCKMNFIERLTISNRFLTSNAVDAALTYFPKLVSLRLSGEMVSSLNVVLHNPSLETVLFGSKIQAFSYKDPTQPKPLYYSDKHRTTSVEYKDVKTMPILSVESLIKRTWEFVNQSVVLALDD